MSERPTPPRGMRDLLPREVKSRRAIIERIRDVYESFGYSEIETPALEDIRYLRSGEGGENEKLIFEIIKRGLDKNTITPDTQLSDYGLRFDLTVPLARYFCSNEARLRLPFRAIQIGPVWRAERPQRGRFRQFIQCDIDIIGEPSILAETELVSATCQALSAVGLHGFQVRLNDRRLLHLLLDACGFPADAHRSVLITVDKIDKIGLDGVTRALQQADFPEKAVKHLAEALDGNLTAATDPDAIKELLPAGSADEILNDLEAIHRGVTGSADTRHRLVFDLSLVRGMGYYTGPIFEIEAEGINGSIAGGGRYDGMINRFLGKQVPACGFSIGFERLWDLLGDRLLEEDNRLALVCRPAEQPVPDILKEAAELRASGYQVEVVPVSGKAKGLFPKLAAAGFRYVKFSLTDEPLKDLKNS